MKTVLLSDEQIDEITKEWTNLPEDIKDKFKNVYFNMVDKRKIEVQHYNYFLSLINKEKPQDNNIQYVEYPSFNYIDKLYSMNKPNKFIGNLITQAKSQGKLTKSQDYYLKYYLKNGKTPYDAKLLPNNI